MEGLLTPFLYGIFETGACKVPSKSQNPTILDQCGPSSTHQTLAGHSIGAILLAPITTLHFDTVNKSKYLFPHWIVGDAKRMTPTACPANL